MPRSKNTSIKSSIIKQYEDRKKRHLAQKKQFFKYLLNHTASCTMVSKALGIEQKCLCRYKRELEINGRLWQVKRSKCKFTNRTVWYLSTNPSLIPKSIQTKLFEDGE
jgi:hypothetical protein